MASCDRKPMLLLLISTSADLSLSNWANVGAKLASLTKSSDSGGEFVLVLVLITFPEFVFVFLKSKEDPGSMWPLLSIGPNPGLYCEDCYEGVICK